jgi:hypothetical protein
MRRTALINPFSLIPEVPRTIDERTGRLARSCELHAVSRLSLRRPQCVPLRSELKTRTA